MKKFCKPEVQEDTYEGSREEITEKMLAHLKRCKSKGDIVATMPESGDVLGLNVPFNCEAVAFGPFPQNHPFIDREMSKDGMTIYCIPWSLCDDGFFQGKGIVKKSVDRQQTLSYENKQHQL